MRLTTTSLRIELSGEPLEWRLFEGARAAGRYPGMDQAMLAVKDLTEKIEQSGGVCELTIGGPAFDAPPG